MTQGSWRRISAEGRHQGTLLLRDPGPMIGYLMMGVLLITALRPLDVKLALVQGLSARAGLDQAVAGIAIMFSLFIMKICAAHLLNERIWHTWDRLRASPAGFGEILVAKSAPILVAMIAQQAIFMVFAATCFTLRPTGGWLMLATVCLAWSLCLLCLAMGASTLFTSPAQLSAAGDVFALVTTVFGGTLIPVAFMPRWMVRVAPASPGYWALRAYRAALLGSWAQLRTPALALAAFAVFGVLVGVALGRRLLPPPDVPRDRDRTHGDTALDALQPENS